VGFAYGSGNVLNDWQKILAKEFAPRECPSGYDSTKEVAKLMGVTPRLAYRRLVSLYDAGQVERLKVVLDGAESWVWKKADAKKKKV